jgi:hypothetical protein
MTVKRVMVVLLGLAAAGAGRLPAQGIDVSGVLDSTINGTVGAGGADNSWGVEEYANLRLRAGVGEKAVFNAAFNLAALAGNFAETAAGLGSPNTSQGRYNYAAAIELERLYFRVNGEYVDAEAGLMRLAFGYGQVWGSSDFLNPRNPLFPNARPRGVLGASFAFYPADSLKLTAFGAAPKNPLESGGGGIIPGFSVDRHWDRASLQVLYAFETPGAKAEDGLHRFGLSLKADLELGFAADALYTLDPSEPGGIGGLSTGAGFDYSFLDGKLYVLAEYLFNGSSSSTALNAGLTRRNYLYGTILWRFNDYTSLSISDLACLDDGSFSLIPALEHELFQGMTLSLNARIPLDRESLSGGAMGEFGPRTTGSRGDLSLKASLRF